MSSQHKKDGVGFMETLCNFLGDTEDLTKEDLCAEMETEGVNTVRLQEKVAVIVKRESQKRRLAWREEAMDRRLRIKKMLSSKSIATSGHKLLDTIRNVLRSNYSGAALERAEAYFRNKKDLSEKDLENLIQDLTDIDILEDVNQKKDT